MPTVRPVPRGRSGGYAEGAVAKLSKWWDKLTFCQINRSNGVQQVPIDREVAKDENDQPADMLDALLREISQNADENGPAYYKIDIIGRQVKKGEESEGVLDDFVLPGGDADAAPPSVKTEALGLIGEQRSFQREITRSLKEIVGVVAEREKSGLEVMQQAAAIIKSGAESQTVLVDLAKVRLDEARDQREAARERAEAEASQQNVAAALEMAAKIAGPLAQKYAAWLEGELADKREEKRRERARKHAAEAAAAEPEPEPEPKRRGKKKRKGTPERPPRAKRATAAEAPAPEPTPEPPKHRPSAGLAEDAAAFLDDLPEDEGGDDEPDDKAWASRHMQTSARKIVGEDLWSCLVACSRAPSDDNARAVMAKAVDIVAGPLLVNGGGEREQARSMPKRERERIKRELGALLGPRRGLALQALLAKGGVTL